MPVLSASARRLVDTAVADLPNKQQQAAWHKWSSANPGTSAGKSTTDIPAEMLAIALLALETQYEAMRKQREIADEDARFFFDNDLSFIAAVQKSLATNHA